MSSPTRRISRREFLIAAGACPGITLSAAGCGGRQPAGNEAAQPNILWITCEDMSPNLGCYGDAYARTPNIDRLAGEGVRFTHVFATAPVCSPVRSCLITGVYATSLGTQNLRSQFPIPDVIKGFPSYLRARGYYCSNNVKTDYNTSNEKGIIEASWDACSSQAHWRSRRPGQPFFSVFNDMTTHQSRSMVWPYEQFQSEIQSQLAPAEPHDPAQAPVPPYYPDTPVIRRTVARYYDCITVMDRNVGKLLAQLDEDKLAEETIVFFYSDHGAGLPRHKRSILDTGLHVPLIVRFPERYRHLAPAEAGRTVDRLVSFVDFPPTVLSLASIPIPDYMQGQAFMGPAAEGREPREYVFGARDRVDEAYDLARCVRDENFLYIRNFMPHLSYNQPSFYSDQGEIRQEITRLAAAGRLSGPQLAYAGPTRPLEELYDTQQDPYQVRNLAESAEHKPVLERLRGRLRQWMSETHDIGLLPEVEMARRAQGSTPHDIAANPESYDQARILAAADLVGRGPAALLEQVKLLADADAAVRYWAAVGLKALGQGGSAALLALTAGLADRSADVRIEAAAVLCGLGRAENALTLLEGELQNDDLRVALRAARVLEQLGPQARPALAAMKRVYEKVQTGKGDDNMFVKFALEPALKNLEP